MIEDALGFLFHWIGDALDFLFRWAVRAGALAIPFAVLYVVVWFIKWAWMQ